MSHYVVINDWATNDAEGVDIIAVKHTLEEAKEIFNKQVTNEKEFAKEHEYEIFEDTDVMFDAGETGYWAAEHTKLYIQGVV